MGKNKGKLRKKPAGKDDNAQPNVPKPKPPSFLLPSSAGTSATTSLDAQIEGLPKTPGKENRGFDIGSSSTKPSQEEYNSTSGAKSSSTSSSPPHDATAVLAALAAKSPRAPSPRPPSSPHVIARSHALQRDPSDGSGDRPASIHSTASNAPSVIRRDGKGVSFMPSSPHAVSAFEHSTDPVEASAIVERPAMGRTASGAVREIVSLSKAGKGKKKEVKGKISEAVAKASASGLASSEVQELDDPITKKEVGEMMQRGTIEVGKQMVEAEHEQVKFVVEHDQGEGGSIKKDEASMSKSVENGEHVPIGSPKWRRNDSGRGDYAKSPSLVPQKRDLDEVPTQDSIPGVGQSPRPKRRILLDSQYPSHHGNKDKDSEDERVLNEVPDPSLKSTPVKSSHTMEQWTAEDEVYVPPYKPRKKNYTPQPLLSSVTATEQDKLAVAVSATITRHSTIPFSASRRVELRLAWKEPKNWLWIPGRKYIPDWDMEFVVKGQEERVGLRGLLKGSIGWIPIVGRLANWI